MQKAHIDKLEQRLKEIADENRISNIKLEILTGQMERFLASQIKTRERKTKSVELLKETK
jgi:hypothetical protein